MFAKQTESKIIFWIENHRLNEFAKYLMSGVIHGRPGAPVAELSRIEKIIKKHFPENVQFLLAKNLLKRPEYTARNIGAHLLASGWPANRSVETCLIKAADDSDWIVREYAAGTFATLLEKDFAHFSKLYLKWIQTESVNVKRAIALAVKYDSKSGELKKWKTYFTLIDPLMSADAEYIRKNLGPFAIGDGLLSRFPDSVLTSCKKWVRSKNQNVRWNTAMIFTAAAARKFPKEGRQLLQVIESDSSSFVARAAKKALKNLEKK